MQCLGEMGVPKTKKLVALNAYVLNHFFKDLVQNIYKLLVIGSNSYSITDTNYDF